MIARRKGWEIAANIWVIRGRSTTNHIEFSYGSIEVTSEPSGLVISTNGVVIGKTPATLSELKPGQYELAATDGENDLQADISVGPKETAKHAFVFRYGTVQLASIPAGATVIRRGKDVGKTPLTLERIPDGDIAVEIRLAGYVSTNFPLRVQQGATTDLAAKLVSERYLQAMKEAREKLEAGQFEVSRKLVTAALEMEPGDSTAIKLRSEISEAEQKAEEARREAARKLAQVFNPPPRTPRELRHPSMIISKSAWSEPINVVAANFSVISVDPPVRRLVMLNNDPNRVIQLPAGIASEIDHGKNIRTLQYKIADDETASSAIMQYRLER